MHPPPHRHRRSDLPRQAARAVPWTLLSYGASRAITLLTTIVLARLLTPADFGLVAIATLVVGAIALFGHVGLGNAVILEQDVDPRALRAALAVMVAAGVAGASIAVLAAPLVAGVFQTHRAEGVVAASAAALAYSGLGGFYEALLRRELRTRALFACELLRAGIFAGTSISLAAVGAGVWSLVAGGLASSAGFTVAVVAAGRPWLWPRWERSAARRFWRAGKGFVFQSALWFASVNADYAVVGRFGGPSALGAYTMAYRLSETPNQAIADPVAQVSFPSFAQLRHAGDDLRVPYLRVLSLVALVACPLATLLSATADPFVDSVLGGRWRAAVDPLAILGIAGVVLPLSATGGWLLSSVGQAMTAARISGLTLLVFLGPLVVAADASGIVAVAGVMLARALAAFALLMVATRRRAGVAVLDHVRTLRGVIVACGLAWVVSHQLAAALEGVSAPGALAAALAAGTATYVIAVRLLDARLLRLARSQLQLGLSRRVAAAGTGSASA